LIETTFGYLAAFCTTASFLPQVIKVFKTKHTKDISLGMFLLMTAGVSFWLVYGLLISSPPIIMANTVTVVLSFYILFMKVKLDGLNLNKANTKSLKN
jgi:MtN3 and saliva related transmembrane protein